MSTAMAPNLASAADFDPMEIAVLRGLDKVTARISTFEGRVGETVAFGTLVIAVRSCFKAPPVETPESASFLQIDDTQTADGQPKRVFSGWMYASSPGVSTLEHPVYDISVIDCALNAPAATTEQVPETAE